MIGRARGHEDAAAAQARRRFEAGSEKDEEGEATTAGCRYRSCAAVAVADCVALGCCPCAVVGLLGLALVRAPLAVGRRLVRRRRRALLRGKRVRDVAATASASGGDNDEDCEKGKEKDTAGGVETARAGVEEGAAAGLGDDHEADDQLAWLEEMYRAERWGFGRVSSFSAKTP